MSVDATAIAIEANDICKAYGPTKALDNVSFQIGNGSVHALLGENGAGKSTFVKVLSGLVQPDDGTLKIFDQTAGLPTPRHSHNRGIQTAFQEMTLVSDLTVLENMLIPYAPVNLTGLIKQRSARASVSRHLASLDISIDLDENVAILDLAERQKIEIARAIYRKPQILLLDEPTSSLAGKDVDWLGEIINRLKSDGKTIVFISHRMPEVRMFCDTLTILRNGRHITTGTVNQFTDDDVVEKIIGRSIDQTFPPKGDDTAAVGIPVLGARNLTAGQKLRDVSFDLQRGEILGVAGLQGMGQLDLFHACFGMEQIEQGHLEVDGNEVWIGSPTDAMQTNIAIGLLPEDRKTEGLFLELTGLQNASLPVIDTFTKHLLIESEAETKAVQTAFNSVDVDQRAMWTAAGAFSGGNQQKIAIAKWLVAQSRILLLFDPTRGIDVGTKHELYVLMRDYVSAGGSILFHSTEIPELVHQCDRVLVLYNGDLVAELSGDEISENAIMTPALGHLSTARDAVA